MKNNCQFCSRPAEDLRRVRQLCNGQLIVRRVCGACELYLRENHPNIYSHGERIPKVLLALARR